LIFADICRGSQFIAEEKVSTKPYLRVSTDKQGHSGLGVEGQRKAVADYLNGGRWKLLAEYREVESGKHADRP
jgi:DNA invertase Pin-like site-specific DNA recombinase